jgi:pyruvate/2-oxoglutarate dehydrogenase complex dihydrolipoamide acyltransferase (E2) component
MSKMDVKLPDMGEEAGDEARVSFWYVEPGEDVEKEDPLVQLVTDKATFDVPSPSKGTLREVVADEDAEVRVGDVLCRLETED